MFWFIYTRNLLNVRKKLSASWEQHMRGTWTHFVWTLICWKCLISRRADTLAWINKAHFLTLCLRTHSFECFSLLTRRCWRLWMWFIIKQKLFILTVLYVYVWENVSKNFIKPDKRRSQKIHFSNVRHTAKKKWFDFQAFNNLFYLNIHTTFYIFLRTEYWFDFLMSKSYFNEPKKFHKHKKRADKQNNPSFIKKFMIQKLNDDTFLEFYFIGKHTPCSIN